MLSTLDPDELDEGSVTVLLWALTSMPEEVLTPEKTEPRAACF